MSDNNHKGVKFDLVKEIITKYDPEILKWLKDNHYKYKVCEIKDTTKYQTEEEINEELPLIAIPKEIYRDLDDLCKINNWDVDKKIIGILRNAVFSAEIHDKDGFKQVINF